MRVLIVHNYYQRPGGERRAVEAQIDLLRRHGHTALVYTRDSSEIMRFNAAQKAAFLVNTVWSSHTYGEIRSLVERGHPDVAHVHNVFPLISPTVYRALADAGVPIVQSLHNYRLLCPNGLFYVATGSCERCKYGNTLHAVWRKCYRESRLLSAVYALSVGLHRCCGTFQLVGRYTAPTDFVARKYVQSGLATKEQITVLANFLPEALPMPGSFQERRPYVLFTGRLSREKGIGVLLEAMDGLNLELQVMGDGPEAESLHAAARGQRARQVTFLGHVEGSRKWRLLREATATVVPSLCFENMPFVILESLATGTPVVGSDHGSLPSIIEDGRNGLLFRTGNADDLRARLRWLVAHPQAALAMGRRARLEAETRYCAERHYTGLMAVYDEVRQ